MEQRRSPWFEVAVLGCHLTAGPKPPLYGGPRFRCRLCQSLKDQCQSEIAAQRANQRPRKSGVGPSRPQIQAGL